MLMKRPVYKRMSHVRGKEHLVNVSFSSVTDTAMCSIHIAQLHGADDKRS